MTNEGTSPPRRRLIEEMAVRNLSPTIRASYIHNVKKFSQYFGRSPDCLGLPRALHRAGGRALAGWGELGRVPAWVFPARARALNPVPGRVSGEACCCPQGWALELLLRSGAFGREERIFCLSGPALAARLGGRLQASLCRTLAGSALLEPLHAPRSHLRSSPAGGHR